MDIGGGLTGLRNIHSSMSRVLTESQLSVFSKNVTVTICYLCVIKTVD